MQLFRFVTDADAINKFINGAAPNKNIYEALRNRNFALVPTTSKNNHFTAVNRAGTRIYSEYDYDFATDEIEKYLEEVSASQAVNTDSLVEWAKTHGLGNLTFDKVVRMYDIAHEE